MRVVLGVILLAGLEGCWGETKVDTGTPPVFVRDSTTWETGTTGVTTTTTVETGGPGRGCDPRTAVVVLGETDVVSPYATQLVRDMDGGGLPEVLFEGDDPRAVQVLRGEDLVVGNLVPWFSVPGLNLSQAGFAAGSAGDVDGDGRSELLLVEANEDENFASVHSAADPGSSLFSVQLVDAVDDFFGPWPYLATNAGPDLWGDGVPEVAVGVSGSYAVSLLYVFDGTTRGAVAREDARLVVNGVGPGAFVSVSPDLDADGNEEFVLVSATNVALVPVGLSGVVTTDDLDVVLTLKRSAMEVEAYDVDDDGLPEWFLYDDVGRDAVIGFTGGDLAGAARGGSPLDRDGRWITVTGGGYLGAVGSRAVSDSNCETGLAVTAHFDDAVRIVDHPTLLAGGHVDADGLPSLRGATGSWFGYALGGSEDVDGDGTLDLIVADSDPEGAMTTVFLGAGLLAK